MLYIPEPAALDITPYYVVQRQAVLDEVARGELRMRRDIPIEGQHLSLRVYERIAVPTEKPPCD